jgi:uncharacterized membrane protein YhhN
VGTAEARDERVLVMIATLIWLIVVLAIFAIVWWAIQQMGLPDPIRIVVIAVMAIIALLLLLSLVPGTRTHWPW